MLQRIVSGIFIIAIFVRAENLSAPHRLSLKGLLGVQVIVEDLDTVDDQKINLPRSTLETDVELELRQFGIRVLTQEERLSTPGQPFLYINVNVLDTGDTGIQFAGHIHISLNQKIRLTRNPLIEISAETWQTSALIVLGRKNVAADVRSTTKDLIEKFVNAYLAENPRRDNESVIAMNCSITSVWAMEAEFRSACEICGTGG